MNTVELDFLARLGALRTTRGADGAVLIFFDVAAAFPSVARAALLRAAQAAELPVGMIRLISALYAENTLWIPGEPDILLCTATAGVAQGCPLSATLFVLAMDVWTAELAHRLEAQDLGVVRLCADDIGLYLHRVSSVDTLSEHFQRLERYTALRLNTRKCHVVVVSDGGSVEAQRAVARRLVHAGEPWAGMDVRGQAEYLGVQLGPAAHLDYWRKAIAKYRRRVDNLVARAPPTTAIPGLYSTFAVSVLVYLATIADLPKDFADLERHSVARLFRLPGNTLPRRGWVELGERWGWPKLLSVAQRAAGARLAFAARHADFLRALVAQAEAAWDIPLASLTRPTTRRDHWRLPSLVHILLRGDRESDIGRACVQREAVRQETPRIPLQRQVWQAEVRDSSRWVESAIIRRLHGLLGPHAIDREQIEQLRGVISRLPQAWAVIGTRTVLNAWCTSRRMHDPRRDTCVWGCAADDSLDHYIECEVLTHLLRHCFEHTPTQQGRSLWRLCPSTAMCAPVVVSVGVHVCGAHAYHAVRGRTREGPMLSTTTALRVAWETLRSSWAAIFLAFSALAPRHGNPLRRTLPTSPPPPERLPLLAMPAASEGGERAIFEVREGIG